MMLTLIKRTYAWFVTLLAFFLIPERSHQVRSKRNVIVRKYTSNLTDCRPDTMRW